MQIDTRELQETAMTPEEAEAIFELWAKRQAETETLRSRLTVEDMAEAISASPREVELMLRLVRSSTRVNPTQVKSEKTRKRRSRWLILLAVIFWLGVLTAAYTAVYFAGLNNGRRSSSFIYSSQNTSGAAILNEMGNHRVPTGMSYYFAKGMAASFQDYVLDGQTDGKLLSEANYEFGLKKLIEKLEPGYSPYASNNNPGIEGQTLEKSLRTGNLDSLSGVAEFHELKVKFNGKEVSVKIPVPLVDNYYVREAIGRDQERRLKIFANQVRRLAKTK